MLRTFSKVFYVLGIVSLILLLGIFFGVASKAADGFYVINMTHFFQMLAIPGCFFLAAVVGRYIAD